MIVTELKRKDSLETAATLPSFKRDLAGPVSSKLELAEKVSGGSISCDNEQIKIRALLLDKNPVVAEHAAACITANSEFLREPEYSDLLSGVIRDCNYLTARILIKGLTPERPDQEVLLTALLEDSSLDWRVRHVAGEVLSESAEFLLIEELSRSKDETVRYFAIKGATRFPEKSFQLLLEQLDSDYNRLHQPAAFALKDCMQAQIRKDQELFFIALKKVFPDSLNRVGLAIGHYGSLEEAAKSLNSIDLSERDKLSAEIKSRLDIVHTPALLPLKQALAVAVSDFLSRASRDRSSVT